MWYFFYLFLIVTGMPVFYPLFRTKTYYENPLLRGKSFKPKTIVISNHTNIFDYVVIIMMSVPRYPYTLAAEILYEKNIFFTLLLKCMRTIRVDRRTHETRATQRAIDAINQGKMLCIFPEGRLPEGDEKGTILPFHSGFVRMALETGAKVVPMYTNGKLFSWERTRVMVGEPVDVRSLYDESISEEENVHAIAEIFRNKICQLGENLAKKTK